MTSPSRFLLDCQLPPIASDLLIAQQADLVQRLLVGGMLLHYALSDESRHWWAIVEADTEWEARQLANQLPLCEPDALRISMLSQYTSPEAAGFSLN
jgi:hypothetical protein